MQLPTSLKISLAHATAIIAGRLKIDQASIEFEFADDEAPCFVIATTSTDVGKLTRRIGKSVAAAPEPVAELPLPPAPAQAN